MRKERIVDGELAFHVNHPSKFQWVDLFAAGPGTAVSWTASYSDSGVLGQATLATKEKGRRAVEEAATQLSRMVLEFADRPKPPRGDHHVYPPTFPMPWAQHATNPDRPGDVHG